MIFLILNIMIKAWLIGNHQLFPTLIWAEFADAKNDARKAQDAEQVHGFGAADLRLLVAILRCFPS